MSNIIIAPSTDPSPIEQLPEYLVELQNANADWLHCDIMDGEFVPKETFDEVVLNIISRRTRMVKDVHLMIANPTKRIPAFIDAGADIITIHYEAYSNDQDILNAISIIKKLGKLAGLSIKPNTDVSTLEPFLTSLDLVLIMSVEPGKSGQQFLPNSIDKIKWLSNYKKSNNLKYLIEVDGGVNLDNIGVLKKAGVDVVVSGSAIYNAQDRAEYIKLLKAA